MKPTDPLKQLYPVNWASLGVLLRSLGEGKEYLRLLRKAKCGRLGLQERNGAIRFLLEAIARNGNSASEVEVADSFCLGRERVGQLKRRLGIKLPSAAQRRNRIFRKWFHELTKTPSGRKKIFAVMRQVAQEPSFWSSRPMRTHTAYLRLRSEVVLRRLGYPASLLNSGRMAQTFAALLRSGAIKETHLIGVILRYGLGVKDVRAYLKALYCKTERTLRQSVAELDRRGRAQGCLPVGSWNNLASYLRLQGLKVKTRGSRDPYWLHKIKRK